jgi:hypothetical protein
MVGCTPEEHSKRACKRLVQKTWRKAVITLQDYSDPQYLRASLWKEKEKVKSRGRKQTCASQVSCVHQYMLGVHKLEVIAAANINILLPVNLSSTGWCAKALRDLSMLWASFKPGHLQKLVVENFKFVFYK